MADVNAHANATIHAAYALASGAVNLASIPLRLGNEAPIGVLGLERAARPFSEEELIDLTFSVNNINTWNRLNIAFQTVPGDYRVGQFG